MRIYLTDLDTGERKLIWLYKREITLDHNGKQHRTNYPLHLRADSYNLIVNDRGLAERVTIAGITLQNDQPRVWLPHQELQIGDRYLLSWVATGTQPMRKTQVPRSGRRLGSNPLTVFGNLMANLRRGFGLNLERIVPRLAILFFVAIFGILIFFLWSYTDRINTIVGAVPTVTLIPALTTTTGRTPVATESALTPTSALAPTVVRVANLADLPPTATTVGAAPAGTTPTPVPCIVQTRGRGNWDERLDALLVTFKPACVRPGEQFWHLIEAKWLDVNESNGYHHVFVDLLDENWQRVMQPPTQFVMAWTTDQCGRYMQWESDPFGYGANCPMYAAGAAYTVYVEGLPSDMIEKIGLGSIDQRDWRMLTSYQFKFQRTIFNPE